MKQVHTYMLLQLTNTGVKTEGNEMSRQKLLQADFFLFRKFFMMDYHTIFRTIDCGLIQ